MSSKTTYIEGMRLGTGFNTATYSLHPSPALEVIDDIYEGSTANGQEVIFSLDMASSTKSISDQMGVNTRMSLRHGVTGQGSFKASFASSIQQNSFTVYLIARVSVTNKTTTLNPTSIRLNSAAANKIKDNANDFTNQYGDSFVYGLITGGEFVSILEINTYSAEEFRNTKATIQGKASLGLYDVEGSAGFESSLNNITNSYNMRCTVFRQGGAGAISSISPTQLAEAAKRFPQDVGGEYGYPYEAILIPYSHIPHESGTPIDQHHKTVTLDRLGQWRQSLIRYQNDLQYAIQNAHHFPGIDRNEINKRYNAISDEIAKIVIAARQCYTGFTCDMPKIDTTLLENILPQQSNNETPDTSRKRLESGSTEKGKTNWKQYTMDSGEQDPHTIFVEVNTESHNFSKTPTYIVNLHGTSRHYGTTGGSCPYKATKNGFTIYVRHFKPINPSIANTHGWHLQWLALGE